MFRPKVLVIDADRHYREQLMYALQGNYELLDAENRETGLKYLQEHNGPDIILTDLYLPPRPAYTDEGLALLKQFKEVSPKIKIIIVTAEERTEIMARCQASGADDYIIKPFEVGDLRNAIDRLVPEVIPEAIERRKYWREDHGKHMGLERRRYRRVKREIPIRYSSQEDRPSITGNSKTINISATGLLFRGNQSVTPHNLLELELSLQSKPPTIKATGEVRWAKRADRKYNIGVRFMAIKHDDRQRIAEYVYT